MIEVQELRDALGLGDDTSKDDQLIGLEVWAVAHAERETGDYTGAIEEVTEIFSGDFASPIYLGATPANTPVVESRSGDTWTVISAADYEIDGSVLYHDAGWPYGRRNIRVRYERGYEAGDEPTELRQYVKDLVAWRYQETGREGLQSESIGGYSWTRADSDAGEANGMPAPPWRKVRVG